MSINNLDYFIPVYNFDVSSLDPRLMRAKILCDNTACYFSDGIELYEGRTKKVPFFNYDKSCASITNNQKKIPELTIENCGLRWSSLGCAQLGDVIESVANLINDIAESESDSDQRRSCVARIAKDVCTSLVLAQHKPSFAFYDGILDVSKHQYNFIIFDIVQYQKIEFVVCSCVGAVVFYECPTLSCLTLTDEDKIFSYTAVSHVVTKQPLLT